MHLNWLHGYDLCAVVCPDKLRATDSQLADARLDFVILHPARLVGGSAIHEFVA